MSPPSITTRSTTAPPGEVRHVDGTELDIPRCDADCHRCLATRCAFRGVLPRWLERVSREETH